MQIYTWGRNDSGQLGLGHYDDVRSPEHVTALKKVCVQQVQSGYDHCIAFVSESGGIGAPPVEKIFTWGRGEEGQLGHEDRYSRCVPKMVNTLLARGVRLVAAGGFSSAAIDEVKQLYTWGDGRDGQLGHADQIDLNCPQIVKEPLQEDEAAPDHRGTFRARSVFPGPNFMLAMGMPAHQEKHADPQQGDNLIKYSWGSNSHGQLGMPYLNTKKRKTGLFKTAPEAIPFLKNWNITEIACGLEHVVAIVQLSQRTEAEEAKMKSVEGKKRETDEEKILDDLKKLSDGEFENLEDDEPQDQQVVVRSQMAGTAQQALVAFDDDVEENEHKMMLEKLYHPRQIYDRLHSAEPFVARLGLPNRVTEIFAQDESMDFETFLGLTEETLMDMGVESFGARRRLMRAIRELNEAPNLQKDKNIEFEMKLPAYTKEERLYKGVAQHEFHCHPADFLHDNGRPLSSSFETRDYINDHFKFALEEGEDPTLLDGFTIDNGKAYGEDKNKHRVDLILRDDFETDPIARAEHEQMARQHQADREKMTQERELQAWEFDQSKINAPPQPSGFFDSMRLR